MRRVTCAALLVLALHAAVAWSVEWIVEGQVVGISDGDTITLLDQTKMQHKVRFAKLSSEVDKLYDLYQSGEIDKHGFGAKYHPMAERQRQLDDEIPKTQAEVDVLKIAHLSQEEVITEARDLYSRWPDLPQEEKRRIVETITEKIVVGDGDVEINLYYVPSALPPGGPGGPGTPPSTPRSPGGKATKPHWFNRAMVSNSQPYAQSVVSSFYE